MNESHDIKNVLISVYILESKVINRMSSIITVEDP